MIILGIDPGSRITGYGLIKQDKQKLSYIDSGCIHTAIKIQSTKSRLRQIFEGIQQVIETYHPDEVAIERVFVYQNPNTALKLGEARGAAIAAIGQQVSEYAPREIKLAIAGYGAAKKEQVQYMVRTMLNLSEAPPSDAADALAIAVCHAHMYSLNRKVLAAGKVSSAQNQLYATLLSGRRTSTRRGRKR